MEHDRADALLIHSHSQATQEMQKRPPASTTLKDVEIALAPPTTQNDLRSFYKSSPNAKSAYGQMRSARNEDQHNLAADVLHAIRTEHPELVGPLRCRLIDGFLKRVFGVAQDAVSTLFREFESFVEIPPDLSFLFPCLRTAAKSSDESSRRVRRQVRMAVSGSVGRPEVFLVSDDSDHLASCVYDYGLSSFPFLSFSLVNTFTYTTSPCFRSCFPRRQQRHDLQQQAGKGTLQEQRQAKTMSSVWIHVSAFVLIFSVMDKDSDGFLYFLLQSNSMPPSPQRRRSSGYASYPSSAQTKALLLFCLFDNQSAIHWIAGRINFEAGKH